MHAISTVSAPVVDDGQEAKGEADSEGHGHCVLREGGHALENFPGPNDGTHNGTQPWLGQHDVGCTSGCISRTCIQVHES